MKLFLKVLIALSAPFSAFSEAGTPETEDYAPPFYVLSSEKDPSLKKNESVFEFHFANPEFRQAGKAPLIHASYNGIAYEFSPDEKGIDRLSVKPGVYKFQFYTDSYLEVYSDSVTILPGYRTVVHVAFFSGNEIFVDKPVIYLYPPADLEVKTTVIPDGAFTFVYPIAENDPSGLQASWRGIAHPDGSMTINGKQYPYLFWEAKSSWDPATAKRSEGFVVPKAGVTAFLEEKLTEMGLNGREQTDFITYWGPKMTGSDRYFVQFMFNDACNRFAELNISPQPEQLFRVYMLWSPVEESAHLSPKPQVIQTVSRNGFYAIEWGGSEIPFAPVLTLND
jgi:hypothetical protein